MGTKSQAAFSSSINLDYSRDGGTLTGTATAASISGGKISLVGGDQTRKVLWKAYGNLVSNTNQGCIRLRYTPAYSGVPASLQFIFAAGLIPGSSFGGLSIWQQNTSIAFELHNGTDGGVLTSGSGSYTPASGVEVEIEFNWNATTGVYTMYVDASRIINITSGTGTIYNACSFFQTGADVGDSPGINANFSIRDLEIYSALQNSGATRTTGYSLATPVINSDPGESNVRDTVTYNFNEVVKTGTYRGLDLWASVGAGDLALGVSVLQNGVTVTGTYEGGGGDAPSGGEFTTLESQAVDLGIQTFGRIVTYTRSGGQPAQIKAIFDNAFLDIEGVSSVRPILRINLADLTGTPGKGDTVVISGVNYRVLRSEKDGFSGATLILQKV